MVDPSRLGAWVAHVFDHPVAKPEWYTDFHAPGWDGDARETVGLITETFERSEAHLARFTDEQLNQGFWYLLGSFGLAWTLTDPGIPMEARRRALRSMVRLFEQLMVSRCSGRLAHEGGGNPLDGSCYMWFDIIDWWLSDRAIWPPEDWEGPGWHSWRHPDEASFQAEVFEVLRATLAIPHDSCRESALHGLGHFRKWSPTRAAAIIDEFLATTPALRPELASYARDAREGKIQ